MLDLHVSEPIVRLGCFAVVLLLMAAAEVLLPRRRLLADRPRRWLNNLALAGLNTIVVRVLLPAGAVGVAVAVEARGWGLFTTWALPYWLAVLVTVVALDFVIYLQHVLFHAVPVLWRLHRVHHADLDFDVTTALRFHTLEILVSMGIKVGAIAFLGATPLGVLIFEVLLNATAMFSHGNVRLPGWLDRILRLVVVTPDMHRVHHSVDPRETNSNFGFNLPWWDYLLGTYRAQPAAGHEGMTIGVAELRDEQQVERLPGMLLLPFVRAAESDAAPGSREHEESNHRQPVGV
jgi:sterol desaturase/sphingolipid hydroxylase (fatty acid hydroxylase superfamily)